MNQFNTLRTISGVCEKNTDWDQAALILVDYQNEYTRGMLPLGKAGTQAIHQAQTLLNFCREQNVPVFHVVHHAKPGSAVFNPQTDILTLLSHSLRQTMKQQSLNQCPIHF